MAASDGEQDDMMRHRFGSDPFEIDDDVVDGLVSGDMMPDAAPPAYASVAQVIEAATRPPRASEQGDEELALAMFEREHAAQSSHVSPLVATRRRAARSKQKVAATALAAGVLLIGGAAAAATTGGLPAQMQQATHDLLSHVGLGVPDGTPKPVHGGTPNGNGSEHGPSAPGPGAGRDCPATENCASNGPGQTADSTPGQRATPATSAEPARTGGGSQPATPTVSDNPAVPANPTNGRGSTSTPTTHLPRGQGQAPTTKAGR